MGLDDQIESITGYIKDLGHDAFSFKYKLEKKMAKLEHDFNQFRSKFFYFNLFEVSDSL